MSVYVVAHINAKPEGAEEVKQALLGLLEPTRKEAGCIRYDLFQEHADSARFTFTEEWKDDASLDAHLAAPHVGNAIATVGHLLAAEPDIRRYRMLG